MVVWWYSGIMNEVVVVYCVGMSATRFCSVATLVVVDIWVR